MRRGGLCKAIMCGRGAIDSPAVFGGQAGRNAHRDEWLGGEVYLPGSSSERRLRICWEFRGYDNRCFMTSLFLSVGLLKITAQILRRLPLIGDMGLLDICSSTYRSSCSQNLSRQQNRDGNNDFNGWGWAEGRRGECTSVAYDSLSVGALGML